jgi:PTS system N-acetylglucosamine-specific IIC component
VLRLADGAVQVVVGPIADQLAADIRQALRTGVQMSTPASAPATSDQGDVNALLAALGGRGNLVQAEVLSTRLRIEVRDSGTVDEKALHSAGFRSVGRVDERRWHVIVGPDAATVAARLRG